MKQRDKRNVQVKADNLSWKIVTINGTEENVWCSHLKYEEV